MVGDHSNHRPGMLMQMLPAFCFGLYLQVSELPVSAGILTGLISLVILTITGNPLDGYVPAVNVSVFLNFLVVAVMELLGRCGACGGCEKSTELDVAEIRKVMATSKEGWLPSRITSATSVQPFLFRERCLLRKY